MLYVACCLLHVGCCLLHVGCRVLHVGQLCAVSLWCHPDFKRVLLMVPAGADRLTHGSCSPCGRVVGGGEGDGALPNVSCCLVLSFVLSVLSSVSWQAWATQPDGRGRKDVISFLL